MGIPERTCMDTFRVWKRHVQVLLRRRLGSCPLPHCPHFPDKLGELVPEALCSVSEMDFQYLTHIHPGGDPQRIEDHVNGSAVLKIGHVLLRKNSGDHTLVAVATGHFVTHGQFAFHGHIHFDHFVHARGKIITFFIAADPALEICHAELVLFFVQVCQLPHDPGHIRVFKDKFLKLAHRYGIKKIPGDNLASPGKDDHLSTVQGRIGKKFFQNRRRCARRDHGFHFCAHHPRQHAKLIIPILFKGCNLLILNDPCPVIFFNAPPGKHLGICDNALHARGNSQGRVLDIPGLLSENGPEQFFLGR